MRPQRRPGRLAAVAAGLLGVGVAFPAESAPPPVSAFPPPAARAAPEAARSTADAGRPTADAARKAADAGRSTADAARKAGDAAPTGADTARATFAGGCFWCMEPPFDELEGVIATISGYTGGDVAEPTYEQVSAGGTGHREAVQVLYDPEVVEYGTLLRVFWRNVDPTDDGGQFCDRGVLPG